MQQCCSVVVPDTDPDPAFQANPDPVPDPGFKKIQLNFFLNQKLQFAIREAFSPQNL
jgi:hypothetical protein